MLMVRDIMYCKPGKVRPLVDKFLALAKITEKAGIGRVRVMTDIAAERFWTVIAEIEVSGFDALEKMASMEGMNEADSKQFAEIMKGYHDLVDHGRREIYTLEN